MTPLRKVAVISLAALFWIACVGFGRPEMRKTQQQQQQQRQQRRSEKPRVAVAVPDQDISDAYVYLLGRLLILRQLRIDFEQGGFEWNTLVHREPGAVSWANPNLDVVYSEAWVAVDENNCALLHIPAISDRYFTWQMLNGWGETLLNINERTLPEHPSGNFALCLNGSSATVDADTMRIDLPSKISRVLARIEIGGDLKGAQRLQHELTLSSAGAIEVKVPPKVSLFTNDELPSVEAFDEASKIVASEPDTNAGLETMRAKVAAVEELADSGQEARERVNRVIETQAKPRLGARLKQWSSRNNWLLGAPTGRYGTDYVMRTVTNLIGIWANVSEEATYFAAVELDGGSTYLITFPPDSLPGYKARYFWSIVAVDAVDFRVLASQQGRQILNNYSALELNGDDSLTLAFGPTPPLDVPESNWLPTSPGVKYNLTFRFYGPERDVAAGAYFPPQLVKRG